MIDKISFYLQRKSTEAHNDLQNGTNDTDGFSVVFVFVCVINVELFYDRCSVMPFLFSVISFIFKSFEISCCFTLIVQQVSIFPYKF